MKRAFRVTCVTEKNNHGSETYAVKLGLPENWRLGGEFDWNGHIGYEVEAPTSSFVNLFSSEHGKHREGRYARDAALGHLLGRQQLESRRT